LPPNVNDNVVSELVVERSVAVWTTVGDPPPPLDVIVRLVVVPEKVMPVPARSSTPCGAAAPPEKLAKINPVVIEERDVPDAAIVSVPAPGVRVILEPCTIWVAAGVAGAPVKLPRNR
jgi:hypothetical protein